MKYYVVDAFTDQNFHGNPAGVCLLDAWPEDTLLHNIAAENNLAETAFVVKKGAEYELRWFTPTVEVDLCGHATLATGFILLQDSENTSVSFHTQSGRLTVTKEKDIYTLDFPSRPPQACTVPQGLEQALGIPVLGTYQSRDLFVELADWRQVAELKPDFTLLSRIDVFAVVVTARGEDCDFVSRFFGPRVGILEDPVTGSSHTSLIPFWCARLGKTELFARQLSPRGGTLYCQDCGQRVRIGGHARLYLSGEILAEGF